MADPQPPRGNRSSNKRKAPQQFQPPNKRPRGPPPRNMIPQISSSTAFPNNELNVARFVRAREAEIKNLEAAMVAAKKGQTRRAFQDVPRDMRRRTASHNPRRVPDRLRRRAKQEMRDDNTPMVKGKCGSGVGKGSFGWVRKEGLKRAKRLRVKKARVKVDAGKEGGVKVATDTDGDVDMADQKPKAKELRKRRKKKASLAKPPTPPARFKKRQIHKCWLPTHMFHTKRAHITSPKEPLWRFAIPLTPTAKSYRPTHRATALRSAVAWDISYMSTIGLEGAYASIVGLLHALHFDRDGDEDPWAPTERSMKWMDGTRSWDGWIYEREGESPKKIAPVIVIWCAREQTPQLKDGSKEKRKVFIRIHPAGFFQLWGQIVKVAKVQKPAVSVEDLRFEIGSIEMQGPGATETLCGALWLKDNPPDNEGPKTIWQALAPLNNIRALPWNPLLAFDVMDPRLHYPPRRSFDPEDTSIRDTLTHILAQWPVDDLQSTPAIFSRDLRLAASRCLPSDKTINRRRTLAPPGSDPDTHPADPSIPVLLYASRQSGSWTVLLPWKCVEPVWQSITYYPLSTGGNPRIGGLQEMRQVAFEASWPWFPGDYPGTDAGWGWEMKERIVREKEWAKRPKGKRIEWESLDLGRGRKGEVGRGWACDWERILNLPTDEAERAGDVKTPPFRQLPSETMRELLASEATEEEKGLVSSPYVFTAKITLISRGVPKSCARIYRLPTIDLVSRRKWLTLKEDAKSVPRTHAGRKCQQKQKDDIPAYLKRRALASGLLEPALGEDDRRRPGHPDYPIVPDEEDLVGFITTGNYNLGEGICTGVANFVVGKTLEAVDSAKEDPQEKYLCIVREAGQGVGRLAKWEVV